MRTAIFVYQPTVINFSSSEGGLQLCCLGAESVSLSEGDNARTIVPGIYKIVSNQDVKVTGDTSAFDIIATANNKDNVPTLPPRRVVEIFAPLELSTLQAFFAVPDAKDLVNP